MPVLSEAICRERLLAKAEQLKARGFRPGFDQMTADAAYLWIQINGDRLSDDLASGRYKPLPAISFTSAKHNGTYRTLARCTAWI